jgi:hypothetical protein
MKCIRCGIDIPNNEKFCHSCGINQGGDENKYTPFEERKQKKSSAGRDKIVAVVVRIIAVIAAVGFVGRHEMFARFYINQVKNMHWDKENYPNITYAEAVDEAFSNVKWTQGKSQNNNGVEVTLEGKNNGDDVKINLTLVMDTDAVFNADKIMYTTSRSYINGEWKDYEVKDMLANASEAITAREADAALLKAQRYAEKHLENIEVIYPDQGEKVNRNYFKEDNGRSGYTFWAVEQSTGRKLLGAIIVLDNGKIEYKDWTN